MITGAAFCPHPPLLVPAVAAGAAAELAPLRAACESAIQSLYAGGATQIALLGSAPSNRSFSPLARGSFRAYGADLEVNLGAGGCGGPGDLPLSLTVGAWLLGMLPASGREGARGQRRGALGFGVGPNFASSGAALELLALAENSDLGLLVMGDGAARGRPESPGYLDARAAGFDAAARAALREGDGDALAALDPMLGQDVLAAGVPAWRAAGDLLAGGPNRASMRYDAAPYGVTYFVAEWRCG